MVPLLLRGQTVTAANGVLSGGMTVAGHVEQRVAAGGAWGVRADLRFTIYYSSVAQLYAAR